MSYLERLLDGAEVAWLPLGDLTRIKTGEAVSKQKIAENPGEYPVINSGREPLGFIGEWNTEDDPIGITTRGAGVGSITWQEGKYFRGNLNYSVTIKSSSQMSVRYLYHLLLLMQPEIQSLCTFDGIPALNAGNLKGLQIPIPCPENSKKSLAIQAEIVRILDAFTALTAELTAELTARKKQYNYYRDQLLTFSDDEVEWKSLGEVCDFKNGFAFKSSLFKESGLPIIRITNVNGKVIDLSDVKYFDAADYRENTKSYEVNYGDILIAMSGATTGKIGFYDHKSPAYLNQRVGKFLPKEGLLNNRYLYHYLLSKVDSIYILAGGGAQPNLSSNALMEKILVPIPYPNDPRKSLAEQARKAAILDKFDAIAHSISEGLPREIELRQKQYEYYRDQLLNFPKPAEAAAA